MSEMEGAKSWLVLTASPWLRKSWRELICRLLFPSWTDTLFALLDRRSGARLLQMEELGRTSGARKRAAAVYRFNAFVYLRKGSSRNRGDGPSRGGPSHIQYLESGFFCSG